MKRYLKFITVGLAVAACACSKNEKTVDPDTLVRVDKAVLTRSDLQRNIPAGLSSEDSARYAQAYIKAWIDGQMMSQLASKEIDMTEINRMVAQYRVELIAHEYAKRMYQAHASQLPDDSIQAYYDAHIDELKLSRPMVKGVYLKVPDDAPNLPALRKLYRSEKVQDIDKLEKSELQGAVHYDYFRDRWVDWEQIESRIPYPFGASADAFLSKPKVDLDFSQGGFTYLLYITDVLHTGQTMPLEAAKPLIQERLDYGQQRSYLTKLKRELYENGLSEGKIAIYCELEQ